MTKHVGNKSVPLQIMKFNMASPALIEASAGTGKTYTITNLVVRALLGLGRKDVALPHPLQVEDLLVVTFTNVATSDLRKRIFERIRDARGALETFIDRALTQLHKAQEEHNAACLKDSELDAKSRQKVACALANGKSRAKKRKAALIIEEVDQSIDSDEITTKASDYTEDELQNLMLLIDVKKLLDGTGIDPIFVEMITDILERKIVPLRHAVLLLAQAERKINNAAICTIHSFCNSTLTQLYALESGEAFNTELKNELDYEIKEASYNVWRRLFYKENCSEVLVDALGASSPEAMQKIINAINKARFSDPRSGFAGYSFEAFQELMDSCGCPVDIHNESTIENQLLAWLESGASAALEAEGLKADMQILIELSSFITGVVPPATLANFYDIKTGQPGPIIADRSFSPIGSQVMAYVREAYSIADEIVAFASGHRDRLSTEVISNQALREQLMSIMEKLPHLRSTQPLKTKLVSNGVRKGEGAVLEQAITKLHASIISIIDNQARITGRIKTVLSVLIAIVMQQEIDKLCKERNVMGNDDVLRRLDYALNNRGEAGKRLASLIRKRYPLAMIDEFQDTDPVQFNIFSAVYLNQDAIDDQAFCYLIGDPKQSIYAFRGSDINSYLKARQIIIDLTHGKGLYTLDTNYRSQPDIVEASNAIFSTELNVNNTDPFEEENIPFEPVKSGVAKRLASKQKKVTLLDEDLKNPDAYAGMQRSFTLSDLSSITPDGYTPPRGCFNDGVMYDGAANTYVVSFEGIDLRNKEAVTSAYARAAAMLIDKFLKNGTLETKGQDGKIITVPVRPSDIAILVKSGSENDKIQQELSNLQIQSVYYSDKSSVLHQPKDGYGQEGTNPTAEGLDILALMEAMDDTTDRSKIYKVLASGLLCLNSKEYASLISSDEVFEYEVQLLNECSHVWKRYGFMPAFLKWAGDPRHCMSARLLAVHGGERLYTNYCHISEIVQNIHKKNTSLATQIHWFKDLLNNKDEEVSSDDTKKRLESEQDQVKILTIHKSKGLEFPIVLMPFLWTKVQINAANDEILDAVLYYSDIDDDVKNHHRVLNFDMRTRISEEDSRTPESICIDEVLKENTRLLYVAVTRSCHVNVLFAADQISSSSKNTYPQALMRLQGNGADLEVDDTSEKSSTALLSAQAFIKNVQQESAKGKFTVIEATKLFEQYENADETQDDVEAKQYQDLIKNTEELHLNLFNPDSLTLEQMLNPQGFNENERFDERSLNISSLLDDVTVPNVAQSFLYKKAIDTSFNIFSYSSLVAASHGAESSKHNYMLGRDDNEDDTFAGVNEVQEQIGQLPICSARAVYATTPYGLQADSCYRLYDRSLSASALVQHYRDSNINALMIKQRVAMQPPLSHIFPRGTVPGSFMHEVLERIDFEVLKERGFDMYLIEEVMRNVAQTSQYASLMEQVQGTASDNGMYAVGEWFNDVLEAPVVAGKYHCFALSDLQPMSYEREMEFLMSNARFSTEQIDELCAEVANRILPPHLAYLGENLKLSYNEIVGFVTGSIDLACRFDLNRRMPLHERADLLCALPEDDAQVIAHNMDNLRELYQDGSIAQCADPEITGGFSPSNFGATDLQSMYETQKVCSDAEEPDYKYYVIDYKSNSMIRGNDEINVSKYREEKDFGQYYEKYNFDNIVKSIYEHRYDVQFMLYTLALYRFLKMRLSVPFDATYEDLEAFYDKNIGGVMYLYLRGMKANYLRDKVSTGVFSTKLDFDIIYKLDKIFTVSQIDEDEE